MNGAFVISLDFELNWGTFDGTTIEAYGENLLGVRQVVPSLLDLFAAHQIHVTWATVGFLFYETKAELLKDLPTMQPTYRHPEYSSYNWMQHVGADEASDPYHFGKSLVDQIIATPGQTIGTHTYCHLSCLEEGVTIEAFRPTSRRRSVWRHGGTFRFKASSIRAINRVRRISRRPKKSESMSIAATRPITFIGPMREGMRG